MEEYIKIGLSGVCNMIILLIGLLLISYLISRAVKKNYKMIRYSSTESFATLVDILQAIVELELNTYETNVFNDREGLTNSNYANYYTDICNTIQGHISEDFMMKITNYVTEEFVYTLIARKVKVYLNNKVV